MLSLDLAPKKRIGLVAHDNKKQDLIEWARYNRGMLAAHDLVATGTTGLMLERELDLPVTCLQSGPLGGDLQVGAMIADGSIDFLVFFWDPLEPQPHDTDVKSLLRIAVVWNIPVACDRASADFMISSPLMTGSYERRVPDYSAHNEREVPLAEGADATAEGTDVTAEWADAAEEAAGADATEGADATAEGTDVTAEWADAAEEAAEAEPARLSMRTDGVGGTEGAHAEATEGADRTQVDRA
jgi:methylglyoxal synthase